MLFEFRCALDEADDEIRRLRQEAANANIQIFTEKKVAEVFEVHIETLRRMRRERGFPHMKLGDKVYYTNLQLADIAKLLSVRGSSRSRREDS